MVLLVIDTQKGITDERLYEFERFRQNIKCLIDEARRNQVEVVYVRHDDGPGTGFSLGDDEFDIYEEFAPQGNERIFDKTVNNAFHATTGLLDYLSGKGEKTMLIVGLQTNFCIDATVKSGFEHGFELYIPEYANSTFDNEYMKKDVCYHYYNDFIWPERYAGCITMSDAVDMIRRNKRG